MSDNLPDRETLARVLFDTVKDGSTTHHTVDQWHRMADAVIAAGWHPPTPATDGLRAEVVLLCNEAENLGAGRDGDDCWVNVTDLRAALDATRQPETTDRPAQVCDDDGCLHYDHEPAGEPGDRPLRVKCSTCAGYGYLTRGVILGGNCPDCHGLGYHLAVPPTDQPGEQP